MNESSTNPGLIQRLRDPHDREAWFEFAEVYRGLIFRIGQRYGLQSSDIDELNQEVLCRVERQASREQVPTAGFRRWLATVARNAAIDALRKRRPDRGTGRSSIHQQLGEIADSLPAQDVQAELERDAFRRAARSIRNEFTDNTWAAFWMTMVEGASCQATAAELQLSVGAVYTARSRIMQRLKSEVAQSSWYDVSIDVEEVK